MNILLLINFLVCPFPYLYPNGLMVFHSLSDLQGITVITGHLGSPHAGSRPPDVSLTSSCFLARDAPGYAVFFLCPSPGSGTLPKPFPMENGACEQILGAGVLDAIKASPPQASRLAELRHVHPHGVTRTRVRLCHAHRGLCVADTCPPRATAPNAFRDNCW